MKRESRLIRIGKAVTDCCISSAAASRLAIGTIAVLDNGQGGTHECCRSRSTNRP